ncbi:MAG: DUF4268 domain-containing protein [Kouleothrix sp.]|nr:DUF4268 domain-containing protein [Kouleothrix sp.]
MAELAHSATFPSTSRVEVVYWQSVTKMPATSPSIGYITFAFTRARRPRASICTLILAIGCVTSTFFDELYAHRNEIEATFGAPLAWERIDDKHASRVAYYYDTPTVIDATPEELTALRQWGVDVILRLHQALE